MILKERDSSSKVVFNHVVEKIVNGEFYPSMRLTERDLALVLKTSRVPVREALQRLVHDSWLVKDDNGAVYVRRFTEKDIKEIFQLREGLEGIAAREASLRINKGQVSELERIVKILNKHEKDNSNHLDAETKKEYRAADMSFHKFVVKVSGNDRIKSIFATAVLQSQCFFFIKAAVATLGSSLSTMPGLVSHKQIYEAIASGNGEAAEKAMRQHLRGGCEAIIKVKRVFGIE